MIKRQLRDCETKRDTADADVSQLRDDLVSIKSRLALSKQEAAEKLAESLEAKQRLMSSLAASRRILERSYESEDLASKTMAFRVLYTEAARRRAEKHRTNVQKSTVTLFEKERGDYKSTINALEQTYKTQQKEIAIVHKNAEEKATEWAGLRAELDNTIADERFQRQGLRDALEKMRNEATGTGDASSHVPTAEKEPNADEKEGRASNDRIGVSKGKTLPGGYPAQAVSSANACIAQLRRFVDEVSGEGRQSPSSGSSTSPMPMHSQPQNIYANGIPQHHPPMMYHGPHYYHGQPPMVFYPNENGGWS